MVGRRGPRPVEVVLSAKERGELDRWAGGGVSPVLAARARIVLACAEGRSNREVAQLCSTTTVTVGLWRSRFAQRGLAGLGDQPRSGRPTGQVVLSEAERAELTRLARRATSAQALALRARIVLACAEGETNEQVAAGLGCTAGTVGKWRARFVANRLDGLVDQERPGRPASVTPAQIEKVLVATRESTPADATGWSRTSMAKKSGLSASTIGRIWKDFGLTPHLTEKVITVDPEPEHRSQDLRVEKDR